MTVRKSHRHFFCYSYSSEIASTGQPAAQAPQLTQESASITNWPSPSLIAPQGQVSAQAPQEIHWSLILYAIRVSSWNFYQIYCSTRQGKMQTLFEKPPLLFFCAAYILGIDLIYLKFSAKIRGNKVRLRGFQTGARGCYNEENSHTFPDFFASILAFCLRKKISACWKHRGGNAGGL